MTKSIFRILLLTIVLIAALLYVKDKFTISLKNKTSSIEIKAENQKSDSEPQSKNIEDVKPQKPSSNIINITHGNNSPITNKY